MRIIYDNAIDRATLTASSTAGVLVASRMQGDEKAEVWRSTGTTATLTATWAAGERIGGLGGAFSNMSPGTTWRVRVYTLPGDTTAVFDQTFFVCPGQPFTPDTFSQPLGVNSFAFGGSSTGAVWLPGIVVGRKLVIDITDTSNAAGYIEIGRMFAGRYFQPEETAERGAPLSVPSATQQTRSDSGSLRRDTGPSYRKLSVSLSWLSPTDREQLFNIARGAGLAYPLFMSLYPENADPLLEQAHEMWCCLVDTPQMAAPEYLRYATSLDFEEI